MNILLTNDDGYAAPGLAAAYDALSPMGKVHVVAPSSERSACSHAISLHGPIHVDIIQHPELGEVHAVNGTPADCVRLAVSELVGIRFDLVISGINRGANIGVDTFYSGTVAGAREATILGLRGIAVSHAVRQTRNTDWSRASRVASALIESIMDETLPGPGFWNINMPVEIPDDYRSHIHRVPVAHETAPLDFEKADHPDPDVVQYQYGSTYWTREVSEPSDFSVVRNGGIAITAVPLMGGF
ncbi:MAG: 5'/3'-nucleotidase SurE [Planctomycetota bacterium]|jgi:5'-nucleotidase